MTDPQLEEGLRAQDNLPFEEDFLHSCSRYRAAIADLFSAIGSNPQEPQVVSRAFGLDKNLTWKISRFLSTPQLERAFAYLPGATGMKRLLDGLVPANPPAGIVEDVRRAQGEVNAMVARHAGDRATLEVMLDGLTKGGSGGGQTAISRKTAFRGNCGIWGIHAQSRLASLFLAPSAEQQGFADKVTLRGLVGLQRFRSDSLWPLERRGGLVDDSGTAMAQPEEIAVDGDFQGASGPKLLTQFCSNPLPVIRTIPTGGGELFEIEGGPLGIQGATNVFMASGFRDSVPYWASPKNAFGALDTVIEGPVGVLQCDLFVHREIALPHMPIATLSGQMGGGAPHPGESPRLAKALPLDETVVDLGFGTRVIPTTLHPEYVEMCRSIHARFGWDPADFRCYRLTLQYPPMSSVLSVRFALPDPPQ